MPDDPNTIQNTSTPDSSQNSDSAPSDTPSEAQNDPMESFTPVPVESLNEPLNTTEGNPENESSPSGEAPAEPVPADTQSSGKAKSEPAQTPEPETAQIPVNEPLAEPETSQN